MKKRIISLVIIAVTVLAMVLPASAAGGLSDLRTRDWYYNEVLQMVEQKIVSGYPDGTFRGNNPVSMAEFLTILSKITNQPYGSAGNHWAGVQVNRAKKNMWINEKDMTVAPLDSALPRQVAAKLLIKTLGIKNTGRAKNLPFKDAKMIDPDYASYVATAYEKGLLQGNSEGYFEPNASISRGAAAVLAWRASNVNGLKKPSKNVTEAADNDLTDDQVEMRKYVAKYGKQAIIDHFIEAACYTKEPLISGTRKTINVRKWAEPIRYYIDGQYTREHADVIDKMVAQLNRVSGFPGFKKANTVYEANYIIKYVPAAELEYLSMQVHKKNVGPALMLPSYNNKYEINKMEIFLDVAQFSGSNRYQVRRFMYMSLGLYNDSVTTSPTSILASSRNTEPTELDMLTLDLLYSKDMLIRLNDDRCRSLLGKLLPD